MGSALPYRQNERAGAGSPAPAELVYQPAARVDRVAAGGGAFRLVAAPVVLGTIVGNVWAVEGGIATFGALLAASVWWKRKHPKDVVSLRVSAGELSVVPVGMAAKGAAFRVRLDDLEDVVLETKTVQRALDAYGGTVNIGITSHDQRSGLPTDTNRIVLETSGGLHTLTTEFYGHSETTEWFAKIRRFLRSVGWTPLSERAPDE